MTLVSQLLIVTDAYSRARGLSQSRVATLLFNDGKKLALLRAGGDLVNRLLRAGTRLALRQLARRRALAA